MLPIGTPGGSGGGIGVTGTGLAATAIAGCAASGSQPAPGTASRLVRSHTSTAQRGVDPKSRTGTGIDRR